MAVKKSKVTVSYTIDIDLVKEFDEYAAKKAVNKSARVELLIREYLASEKKLKN